MNVLVINCGSSSLKYQLIDSESEAVLAKGLCERIGIDGRLVYQKTGLDKEITEAAMPTHKQAIQMVLEALVKLAKGLCERIGIDGRLVYQKTGLDKEITEAAMPTHKQAIQMVLEALVNPKTGALGSLSEIDAVGHRVVHGGEKFAASTLLTPEVLQTIEECNDLAPLHNPANLIGIAACKELMPNVPMVGVFDTAFHQTMPKKAYLYGLPYEYYEKYKVRRYGFHGTSHSFVSKRTAEFLGMDLKNSKIIVAHLGNGASVSAVLNGECVDTSMGLTPLEGLVMGTRCGDIDPAIMEFIAKKENLDIDGVMDVLNKKSTSMGLTPLEGLVMGTRCGDIDPAIMEFIAKKENLDIDGVMDVLNKKSGVQGLSCLSSDFRDLEAAYEEGNEMAINALEVFSYRVAKYIGAYAAAMNGVDAIAFTAGIGENTQIVRKQVLDYLGYLGVGVDDAANTVRGEDKVISTPDSKVKVCVIPTNEELAIARETVALVK